MVSPGDDDAVIIYIAAKLKREKFFGRGQASVSYTSLSKSSLLSNDMEKSVSPIS